MIELLCLVNRLTCEVDAKLVEHIDVNRAHHGRGVSIAVNEIADLLHSEFCDRVGGSTDSKRDKNFVRMWLILRSEIGSITLGEIKGMSWEIPARTLSALRSAAEAGPKSGVVFPVTICPSGSSNATAGAPVDSARTSAAPITRRSEISMPDFFIRNSILVTSEPSELPARVAILAS